MTSHLPFPQLLTRLRKEAGLTNQALAALAKVPASLIAGVQSGNRKIGEVQARKIATALGLMGDEAQGFVLGAIDSCADKLLISCAAYPAPLLNLLPLMLLQVGIKAENLSSYAIRDISDNGKRVEMLTDKGRLVLDLALN